MVLKKIINKKIAVLGLMLNIVIIFSGFCYGLLTPSLVEVSTNKNIVTNSISDCSQTNESLEHVSVNHQHNHIMPCCVGQQDHDNTSITTQPISLLKTPALATSIFLTNSLIFDNHSFYQLPELSPPETSLIESIVLRV